MDDHAWAREEFARYRAWRARLPSLVPVAAVASGGGTASDGPGFQINPLVFLPLSILSVFVCLYLAWVQLAPEPALPGIHLVAGVVKGQVKVTDGLKDWDLEQGMEVRAGQTVFTDGTGTARLQGEDEKSAVMLYEKSRFEITTLEAVPTAGVPAFKLGGRVHSGEVVMNFRAKESLWSVDIRMPQECRLICRRVILFKAATDANNGEVVVGDGVVAAVGPSGEKAFIKSDQKMVTTKETPVLKPVRANVLNERWTL